MVPEIFDHIIGHQSQSYIIQQLIYFGDYNNDNINETAIGRVFVM